jgi:hypothetical protein
MTLRSSMPALCCSWTALVFTALFVVALSGCAPRSTPPPPEAEVIETEERQTHGDRDRVGPLGIPEGHLPQPGECRVWYPGRPPGQQPPPQQCGKAEASAPPASWVLYRPADDRRVVHVRVTHPRRAGVIVRINLYDAQKGTYLGTKELDDGAPEDSGPDPVER